MLQASLETLKVMSFQILLWHRLLRQSQRLAVRMQHAQGQKLKSYDDVALVAPHLLCLGSTIYGLTQTLLHMKKPIHSGRSQSSNPTHAQ